MRCGILIAVVVLSACTSVDVRPIPASARVDHVCIRFNSDVNVDDFVNVLQEDFADHHVESLVFKAEKPSACHFTVDYTVDRWWDLAPYMIDAMIIVKNDEVFLGSGHYHLNGHGGLDLAKWAGTHSKVDPVMNELLKYYPKNIEPKPPAN